MIKRKETRISKNLLVNISLDGFEQLGVTINISRRGMCIATTEIFPMQSEFQILIAAADDIFSATGLVVWNMKRKEAPEMEVPVGLGIKIKDATPGYYKYVTAIRKNHRQCT